jgi:hypothetical protein
MMTSLDWDVDPSLSEKPEASDSAHRPRSSGEDLIASVLAIGVP